MEFTKHFYEMLEERDINNEWVDRAIESPDHIKEKDDGTKHFIKQIPEQGNRWLRVVVNIVNKPERAITVFFDRRLRR